MSNKDKKGEEMDGIVGGHQKQLQQLRGELAMKNDIIYKQKQEVAALISDLQTKTEIEVGIYYLDYLV